MVKVRRALHHSFVAALFTWNLSLLRQGNFNIIAGGLCLAFLVFKLLTSLILLCSDVRLLTNLWLIFEVILSAVMIFVNANPQLTTLKGHRIHIYIHLGLSKMFHCANKLKMVLFFYFIKIIPPVYKKKNIKYQLLQTFLRITVNFPV